MMLSGPLMDLEVLSPEDIGASSRMIGTQHAAPRSLIAEASNSTLIDKGALSFPEPRRIRDRHHVKYVAGRPRLICGRRPSDPLHLRFAQPRVLSGRSAMNSPSRFVEVIIVRFTAPATNSHGGNRPVSMLSGSQKNGEKRTQFERLCPVKSPRMGSSLSTNIPGSSRFWLERV